MVKVRKSYPAPECLAEEKKKKSGDYKCGDVLERAKNDFRNKCYICEYKSGNTDVRLPELPWKFGYKNRKRLRKIKLPCERRKDNATC